MDQSKIQMKQQGKVNIEKSVASLIEKITPNLKAIVKARAKFHNLFKKDGEFDIMQFSIETEKEISVQEKQINKISKSLQFWEPVIDEKPAIGSIQYVVK